ncbi:DoxX family protein [Flavisolibacter nicotianae]|uniref:DoxX family protein n=1 Tax=Flavisolibacter nicotianae TaxID=2364882 RepID=UPI000EAE4600|nr:DoxX family protein [Flavisolibacter nicotianae]
MTVTNLIKRTVGQPNLLSFFRLVTGIILMVKSISFIRDTAQAKMDIQQTGIGVFSQNAEILAFIVAYLGLLCGFLITVGLFTRVAAIAQIPVLVVAVFFVNSKNISDNVFEFIISMIVLLLLVLFAIKGSGLLSADEYFRRGAAFDEEAKHGFP